MSFDTNVLIGFLQPDDAHHSKARRAFAENAGSRKLVAAVVYAEVLVGAARAGRTNGVDDFLDAVDAEIAPIDREVAREAARLRAAHRSLALPDAMVLAVANVRQAPLVTFDKPLQRFL